jgi:hypothetical protein
MIVGGKLRLTFHVQGSRSSQIMGSRTYGKEKKKKKKKEMVGLKERS